METARRIPQQTFQIMTTRGGWSLSTLVALLFVAALVLPSVSYVGHGLVTAWLMFPVWLMLVLFEDRRLITRVRRVAAGRRLELTMFVCWLLVVAANAVMQRGYTGDIHLRNTITLGMVIVMDLVFTAQGESRRATFVTAFLAVLGLEVLRSLPTLATQSGIVRQVMLQGGGSTVYENAFLAGVGEYSFYTGCAIASPVFLAIALNQRGLRRLVLLATWAAVMAAVMLSTLLGSVLLAVVGFCMLVLLAIWMARRRLSLIVMFAVIAAAGIVAWTTVFSQTDQGVMVENKFELQTTSVLELGIIAGDQTNRAGLWEQSFNTFLENPIFGIGPSTGTDNPYMGYLVGGHSTWLDIPAQYGLVGLFFYLGFIAAAVKRGFKAFRADKTRILPQARIVACALFLAGGTYNPVDFVLAANVLFFLIVLGGIDTSAPANQSAT